MLPEKKTGYIASSNESAGEQPELYFQGSLPVFAGRFRRKRGGYFNGHIPPGTRIGREVRLVKLPELRWVYGYLIATDDGPALYVPSASMLDSIEGFHPIRSGREIRSAPSSSLSPSSQTPHNAELLDDDLDDLTNIEIGEPTDIIDPENL